MKRMLAVVGIYGAGAFGTALALTAARAGRRVILCGRDPARIAALADLGARGSFQGQALPGSLTATTELAALREADMLLLAVPTAATETAAALLGPALAPGASIVVCAKGIERESGLFPRALVARTAPDRPVAVLSGPSFAADIMAGLPTALVLAHETVAFAERLARALNTSRFRVYHADDPRGVEIGGAAKNVLAIAAGIVEARGLGESPKAAIIARGFAEMRRFAAASGGGAETLMGLSGLGDLVLTASSARSRNFAYGLALGRGTSPEEAGRAALAEGAYTAGTLARLAAEAGIEMPISAAVASVIAGRLTVDVAIESLINRPQKAEV